jgi:hypothetical protein
MTRPWRRSIVVTVLLVGLVVTAGCGGSDASVGTNAVKEINVSVVAGTVTPATDRIEVSKGQTVRITVRSDVTDVVHVHGYDKSAALMPDKPATVEFVADKDGLYEVEMHVTKLQLLQVAVS